MDEVLIPKYGYIQCLLFSRIAKEFFDNCGGEDAEYNSFYFNSQIPKLEEIVKAKI